MMRSDLISMTAKELGRLEAMQQLQSGQATQAQIARRLNISVRQVKRLWRSYRTRGAHGLISGHRQHEGNRRRDPSSRAGRSAIVTDLHIRFRLVAQSVQRELGDHDAL